MRAVIVMFDSLNRHMLPPYGSDAIHAPNFSRLAERTATFDNAYAGSMPCIPARREMHTGRYNFLHRSWGPLEPFDDSMPEQLRDAGVHTHLVTDHPHYWEDGGATYHPRFSTWEFLRGQEGDPWKGVVAEPAGAPGFKGAIHRQDQINRRYMATEDLHPQTLTFDAGLEFLETNADADRWLLQLETFDPHEPFFTYQNYLEMYPENYDGPDFDWPQYRRVIEPDDMVTHARNSYSALVSMCDSNLGRVLDFFDEHDLWSDTLLIVNTDHGFLLGEHGWWAKSVQPWFDELVHLPLFVWDPRRPETAGTRTDALVQTIDIAPTALRFFDLTPSPDVDGVDLGEVLASGTAPRTGALFGIHGGHVNVTDGRYVYMRAPVTPANTPLEEYTLMPTHMRSRFGVHELRDVELADPFPFTKGVPTLRLASTSTMVNPYAFGTLLFDLDTDPGQDHPIDDPAIELRMATLLVELMRANHSPASQYQRLGLPSSGGVTAEHLLVRTQADQAAEAARPLPPITDFPTGELNLAVPLVELMSHPAAAAVLNRHLPALRNTELLTVLAGTSVYELAATTPIPVATLTAVAEDLAGFDADPSSTTTADPSTADSSTVEGVSLS